MRYLIIACCLCCAAFTATAAEDWEEDIELVPMPRIAELITPFRPSLIERAQAWMAQYPDLSPHIHAHLSELYHDAAEEMEEMEPEERAHRRAEITNALALVEMEMAVQIKSHVAEQATGDERERLIADLRRELNALFDLKLQAREREIQELEAELNEIREQVTRAKAQRESIINRKLAEIGGGPDVFEW